MQTWEADEMRIKTIKDVAKVIKDIYKIDVSPLCKSFGVDTDDIPLCQAEKEPVKKQERQTEIFEYINRHTNGVNKKVGVIVGINDNGTIKIGWSKCNVKMDVFNKHMGLKMAKERALKGNPPAPACFRKHLRQFSARCVRYFKGAKNLTIPA